MADGDAHASEPSERAFLSPGKAFALLLGVILALGAAIFLLRPDELPRGSVTYPGGGDAPTFELTDAEAIARFEQLDVLRQQAYRAADSSLIDELFVPGSEIAENVASELKQLRSDGISVESEFETIDLSVVSNEAEEIELRQVVLISPKFVSQDGEDVTRQSQPVRQEITWTLYQINGKWLIGEAVITDSEIRDR